MRLLFFSSSVLFTLLLITQKSYAQVNPVDIYISELFDHPTYQGEFVEIHNRGSASQNISGWVLEQNELALTARTTTLNSTSLQAGDLTLSPGEYAVIGRGSLAQFIEIYGYAPGTYFTAGANGAPQIDGGEYYRLLTAAGSVDDRFSTARSFTFDTSLRHYLRNMATYPNDGQFFTSWVTDSYYGNPGTDNLPPRATNDAASTNEDNSVQIRILSNDTDSDGDVDANTNAITFVSTPRYGTFIYLLGTITYTPNSNYYGNDSFVYYVLDNDGARSNNATVSITIRSVNDPPVARNDTRESTNEDQEMEIAVLGNDTDVDGTIDPRSLFISQEPVHGRALVLAAGTIAYGPNRDYFGYDTLYYRVADNNGAGSNVAMVVIRILPVNDAPRTVEDVTSTNEETTVSIAVLSNDIDIDGEIDTRTLRIASQPEFGEAALGERADIIYTPRTDFFGNDVFFYTVADDQGAISAQTRVRVQVNNINDPPLARNDNAEVNEDFNSGVEILILANDYDSDGTLDPASIIVESGPANGRLGINLTLGRINYFPNENYNGADSFVYTVADNNRARSNRATVNVTVNPVNDAPVANDDNAATAEDEPVVIDVLANDEDIDGTLTPASVTVVQVVNNVGTTSVNSNNGAITFRPNANYYGQAIVQYTVNDNSGATSNIARATVTVRSVNDAPLAVDDNASVNEDLSVQINVLANDSDAEGGLVPSSVTVVNNPGNGSASVNGATGVITYTPAANFSGNDSFQYRVADNEGTLSNTATVSVRIVEINDPPVAVDDQTATDEDTAVDIAVLANDRDIDGTPTSISINTQPLHGSVNIQQGSLIRYTPSNNYYGNDSFRYITYDDDGAPSNAATVSITVRAVNDRPLAQNDAASLDEDTFVDVNVLANDTDDGSLVPSSVTVTSAPQRGTVSVNSNTGVIRYTPAANYNGNDSFTYTVNDDGGLTSNAASVSLTIRSINDAPVANDDNSSTDEDRAVTITVLANDTDAEGQLVPSSVTVNSNPANGSANVNTSNGAITYTPNNNYNGNDSFTYTVRDNENALSNTAVVSIRVIDINDQPIAQNDNASTDEDNAVDIDVLANDDDPDGTLPAATITIIRNPSNGAVRVNFSSGVITYTPAANFNGDDSFTYTVNDNDGATSNTAIVSITVYSVNDPPLAVNDFANTSEDTPLQISVLANDTDTDGTIDPATVAIIQNPANGTLSVNATTGIVTYSPGNGWSGIDNFSYRVNDNQGGTSNTASVRITVGAVNDPPIARNDNATTDEDQAVVINVLANDDDVDGSIVLSSVNVTANPAHGTAVVNTSTGRVTYTPAQNYNGDDSFRYTVQDDGQATSNEATVTIRINALNDAPLARNDTTQTNEDTAVEISVLANDVDSDGTLALSSVEVISVPAHGNSVVNTSTGTINYTPLENYNGDDTFTYRVFDNGGAASNTASVSISIQAVNDAPLAEDDVASTDEDIAVQVNVTANDSDVDGTINVTTVVLMQNAANGSAVVNPTTGIVTYTPGDGWSGNDSFTYRVNDNQGAVSNTATVRISVGGVNDAPVAQDDNAATDEDTPVEISVLSNDSDSDGTLVNSSLTVVSNGIHGSANVNTAVGTITFTPAENYNGNDSFTYRIRDNSGAYSNTATVSLTIRPVNDLPVAQDDNASTDEDTPVEINVTANDTDIDGTINVTTVAIVQNPGNGSAMANATTGIVTYTPGDGWSGNDSFTYRVNDNQGAVSNTATVRVRVGGVNDAPLAQDDNAATDEDTPVEIHVLNNDSDSDGTLVNTSLTVVANAVNGTVGVNSSSGTITYTPADNYNGNDAFTYRVSDNNGAASNIARVSVSIRAVNDPPVAQNDAAATDEDTPVEIHVTANDTDIDGTINVTSVNMVQNPGRGSAVVNATTGIINYTPAEGWSGMDTLTYFVHDNQGAESNNATVIVTVNPVNDPPLISVLDPYTFNEDDTLHIAFSELMLLVTDPDHADSLLIYNFSTLQHLQVTRNANELQVFGEHNWFGNEIIELIVSDGALSDTADILVIVRPVNDIPQISGLTEPLIVEEGSLTFLGLWDYVSDVETADSLLHIEVESLTDSLQADYQSSTGMLTLSLFTGFTGDGMIKISVWDDSAGTTSDTIRVQAQLVSALDELTGQDIPLKFALFQNYPNPFNPITKISYDLPKAQMVRLEIYDILGQRIATLLEGEQNPGHYEIRFDILDHKLASGIYIYRLQAGEFISQKKMILIR